MATSKYDYTRRAERCGNQGGHTMLGEEKSIVVKSILFVELSSLQTAVPRLRELIQRWLYNRVAPQEKTAQK